MASIFPTILEQVKTGRVVLPHHVYAIYETLSGEVIADESLLGINTQDTENRVIFNGSLAAGVGTTVGQGTFSSVFGKASDTTVGNSVVFGNSEVTNTIPESFVLSADDDTKNIQYVRSTSTSAGSGTTNVSIEINDGTTNQLKVRIVGIVRNTDGVYNHGSWEVDAHVIRSGSIDVRGYDITANDLSNGYDSVFNPDLDVTVGSDEIRLEDNRSSGSDVNWTLFFDVVESKHT